jgi:hypothetical protein
LTLETNTGTPCELFDLQEDPNELQNRVSDPSFAAVIAGLTEQLNDCVTPATT